ncbi:MAG: hypothetical protein M5U12_01890 [Verrucomicrobia bacterium]|nr:hypothetical protein [Verrucomicrobiota bacterium]
MYPGGVNPDSNGNGYGVFINSSYQFYQGGMLMDAIIASGTPAAVAVTGPAPSGANPGILGRTYADIIQDMVDAYAWAQYDGNPGEAGVTVPTSILTTRPANGPPSA